VTKIAGKEVTLEDGKQYMRTEKLLVDFTLGKSRFRIRDYINDGNILGKTNVRRRPRQREAYPAAVLSTSQSSSLSRLSPLHISPHHHIATDCTSECI
jgi:hypothetical protein